MKPALTALKKPIDVPIQEIQTSMLQEKKVQVFIKREDLVHPKISGNKWRKLKYNILTAAKEKAETLLTFGGAYSNHILAVAAAGREFGFKTIGVIRGEEHLPLNPTLRRAKETLGMQIIYMDRIVYRLKNTPEVKEKLRTAFGKFYLIPEGGTNDLAIKGCTEILESVKIPYDYVCSSCGTGGTLAGLVCSLKGENQVLGFSALKGNFLISKVESLVTNYCDKNFTNWEINTDYHFGGYAKFKPELIDFINRFKENHTIQLDPIYTGKMMFGVFDLIEKNYFKPGTTILAIHTGGLQGIKGFNERFGEIIF